MADKKAKKSYIKKLFISVFFSASVLVGVFVLPAYTHQSTTGNVTAAVSSVVKNMKTLVFNEIRQWQVASDATISTLRPTGDVTQSGTITESTGTTAWDLIDDDPDVSQPGSDYIYSGGSGTHYVDVDITDMPADFDTMDTLSIDFYLVNSGFSDDTVALTAQLYQSDGTTAMSNSMSIGTQASSGYNSVSFTGLDTTSTSTTWDGALLRIQWVYSQTKGPDNGQLRLHAAELDGTYSLAVGDPALQLNYYRWRDDTIGLNATSSGSWLAAENASTTWSATSTDTLRLRMGIANTSAGATSTDALYQLEYAEKIGTTCDDDETWWPVPTSPVATSTFEMALSGQYANLASTTASYLSSISTTTFSNGYGIEDPSNATGPQTLNPANFTELEYAINTYATTTSGGDYCFRATDNGDTTYITYEEYPQLSFGLTAWEQNWGYYKDVEVRNDTSTDFTDMQVDLTIDTASLISGGKLQSACEDLRFVDSVSGQRIPHWIDEDSCGNATSSIWVKLSDFPNTATTTIRMYYGNSNAIDVADGHQVFIQFDDFEDQNFTEWDTSTNWTINSSTVKWGTYSAQSGTAYGDRLGVAFDSRSSGVYEGWVRFNESNQVHYPFNPSFSNGGEGYHAAAANNADWAYWSTAFVQYPNDTGYTTGTWYFVRSTFDFNVGANGLHWAWVNGVSQTGDAGVVPRKAGNAEYPTGLSGWNMRSDGVSRFWMDNVRLRQLYATSTDPVVFVGGENAFVADLVYNYYRWRDDSAGLNVDSGWIALENSVATSVRASDTIRLRVGVANVSDSNSLVNGNFRLYFGEKIGETCGDDEVFYPVPTSPVATSSFEMVTSSQYSNQASTTASLLSNISTTTRVDGYGITSPSNQSGPQSLNPGDFTELEYTIALYASSTDAYCFNVNEESSSAGQEYEVYPEIAYEWCAGWAYNKDIGIRNDTTTNFTDMQVELTIDTSSLISGSKLESTCEDLRFVDLATGNRIPHWIAKDSCDSASTSVWVSIPSFASEATTTVRMYYGNPGASDVASGDEVFIFFDDFENNNFDKWDLSNTWSIDSGTVLYGNYSALSGTNWASLLRKTFDDDYTAGVYEGHFRMSATNDFNYLINPTFSDGGDAYLANPASTAVWRFYNGGFSNYPNTSSYSSGVWYFVKLTYDFSQGSDGLHWLWVDGSEKTDSAGSVLRKTSGLYGTAFSGWDLRSSDNTSNSFRADEVRFRQLYATSSEPSFYVGGEDTCSATMTVSGNVYNNGTANALTECDADGGTFELSLRTDGATYTASCDNSTGAFSFTGVTRPLSGESVIVWINGLATYGALVTQYDGSGDMSGYVMYDDAVVFSSDNTVPTTNLHAGDYDSSGDVDIPYAVTGSNISISDGFELIVESEKTYAPGGNVTTSPASTPSSTDGDVAVEGTLTMDGNTLSVGGDLNVTGAMSYTTGTTTFTATNTGFSASSTDFTNVDFNGSGGGWSFDTATTTITGNLAVTAGTLSGTNNVVVNGDVTGAGVVNFTGGTFYHRVLSDKFFGTTSGTNDWTFYNLTFGNTTDEDYSAAAVKITSANTNRIGRGGKAVVRDSNGNLFVVVEDVTDGAIEIWKSDDEGQTWAEQDSSNNPDSTDYTAPSIAIDSQDIIHIAYWNPSGATAMWRYARFSATSSTFIQNTGLTGASTGLGATNPYTSIAVDADDNPHSVYIDGVANGSTYDTLKYIRNIGGWSLSTFNGSCSTASLNCGYPDIAFSTVNEYGDDDIPMMSVARMNSTIVMYMGDATNPSASWNGYTTSTSEPDADNTPSIAQDSQGNVFVSWVADNTNLMFSRKQYWQSWAGNGGSGWTSSFINDGTKSYVAPTLAANDEDVYILAEQAQNNAIVLYKGRDTSYESEIEINTVGGFQDVRARSATFNNYKDTRTIDYVFSDGTNIYYDSIIPPRHAEITSGGGTGSVEVSNILRVSEDTDEINASTTLNLGVKTWELSGALGTPFYMNYADVIKPYGGLIGSSSTFIYSGNNGSGDTTVRNANYNNLQFNNGSETYAPDDFLDIDGSLTVAAGTLDLSTNSLTTGGDLVVTGTLTGDRNVTVEGGDVTGNGTIAMSDGVFTINGTGLFGGNGAWTFNHLIFGGNGSSATTTGTGTGTTTVAGVGYHYLYENQDSYFSSSSTVPSSFEAGRPDVGDIVVGGIDGRYNPYLQWDISTGPTDDDTYEVNACLYSLGPSTNDSTAFLQRVTSSWTEDGIDVNNQPATTSVGQITMSNTTALSKYDPWCGDITDFYKGWQNGTYSNYGIHYFATNLTNATSTFFSSDYYNDGGVFSMQYQPVLRIKRNSVMEVGTNHVLDGGTYTFNISGATSTSPFLLNGSFVASTSHVIYSAASSTQVATTTYYSLSIQPSGSSPTYTLPYSSITIDGNFTIGDGTNAVTVTANSTDPTVDVGGAFTINASGTYEASNASILTIGGDYTNNGTFTANNGTTTFDGTSQQVLSGSMIGANAFYALIFTNNSGSDPVSSPSIIFENAASSTIFRAETASTKIRFQAANGYTFTNFFVNGQATGSRVQMRSSSGGSVWYLYVTGTQSVQYANPQDSDASGGNEIDASDGTSLEGTGNTNWNFGAAATSSDILTFSISTTQSYFGFLNSAQARYASSTNSAGDTTETIAHSLTASTTATNGYTITVRGATLTSGGNTITPIGATAASSSPGSEQFGMRIEATGGSGQVASPYNLATSYAYDATAGSTDVIATTAGTSEDTTYDIYFLSNIAADTAAGEYSTVITYVITANF